VDIVSLLVNDVSKCSIKDPTGLLNAIKTGSENCKSIQIEEEILRNTLMIA